MVTSTQKTTKTNQYFLGALALVAALALTVGLLVASTEKPAHASTTFTVNSNGDAADASSFDGLCQTAVGTCTLRAAIEQANSTAGVDTIRFSITTADNGVAIIAPNSPCCEDRLGQDHDQGHA